MSLSFVPESIDTLRARYPAAVAATHDVESIVFGTSMRPGEMRRHIFDFEGGLRLIVSRDNLDRGAVIHFSASVVDEEGGAVGRRLRAAYGKGRGRGESGEFLCAELVDIGEAAFRQLSDNTGPLRFLGFSAGVGIPHWVVEKEA